jgi:hypothetical protein
MRTRVPIETGGHGLMNRNTDPSICIRIPSYEPGTAFALDADQVPAQLLEPMKVFGTKLTAILATGQDADDQRLLGRFGWSDEEHEPVSLSDIKLATEATEGFSSEVTFK